MTRQATTQNLRQKIESRHNVTLMPINDSTAITYLSESGSPLTLSVSIIKQYFCPIATDQECLMFLQLCKFQGLNPFLREAYLIKYGSSPAALVVGKEMFTKRAERHPNFRGFEAGIYVVNKDGKVTERKGAMVLPNETVLGGWAKVYVEGRQVPTEITVSFDEYVGRKNDGSINAQWSGKPATMIRKVALMQALREAFPATFGGMYSEEEILEVNGDELPREPIEVSPEFTQDHIQSEPTPSEQVGQPEESQSQARTGAVISENQAKRIFAISKGASDLVKQVLLGYGYESSRDVLLEDYVAICKKIEEEVNA